MEERTVLAAIRSSQSAYRKIEQYIEDGDFSDLGKLLLEEYREFYDRDPRAGEVDLEVLQSAIDRKYPKHSETLMGVARTTANSPDNILSEFFEYKKQVIGLELGQVLVGNGKTDKAEELMEQYRRYSDAVEGVEFDDDKVYIGVDVAELVDHVRAENLISLYPRSLNEAIGGGAPRGAHILLYALPEVGKTATSINLSCGMARDGHKVLYIGNEDPYQLMLMRIVSRMSMWPTEQVKANPQEAQERARRNGYDNIVFASLSPGSLGDVRRLVERYEPDVLVVDQLHKLNSPKRLSKVEHLEYVADKVRDMGKEFNTLTLSITQAADSATNKAILEMGDVYYSNVAIQQAADLMIGLGMGPDGNRCLSLCKNKINGNHSPVPITLDSYLSRVT